MARKAGGSSARPTSTATSTPSAMIASSHADLRGIDVGSTTGGPPGAWPHTLVGLSRHADHHAYASRPHHQLRYFEESPKLPYGYFGTVLLALFAKERLRRRLAAELERRRLGPFAAAA